MLTRMHGANLVYIGPARGWSLAEHGHSPGCEKLTPGDLLLQIERRSTGALSLKHAGDTLGTIPERIAPPYRKALATLSKAGLTLRIRGRVEFNGADHRILFEEAESDELNRWATRMVRVAQHRRPGPLMRLSPGVA